MRSSRPWGLTYGLCAFAIWLVELAPRHWPFLGGILFLHLVCAHLSCMGLVLRSGWLHQLGFSDLVIQNTPILYLDVASLFLPCMELVTSNGSQKELRPTCISAVSTQLTKCCGMGELPNLGGPRCESSLFTRTEWLVPKSPVAYHTLGLLPVCICRHSGHPIFSPAPRRPPFRMGHLLVLASA